jgi:predicted ATPase/transcriptional regulator with XRE-family HTH domain
MIEINSFGYWVQQRRKLLRLTRAELAQRVSCSQETIKKIERDERKPSRQIAELLANALAVPRVEFERFLQAARGERSIDELLFSSGQSFVLHTPPHNLPPQLTPFIGREAELAGIAALLANPECRLLSLVGAGGVGKSRLALKAAENQVGSYRHGVYMVPLAGVELADDIPYTIATTLDLSLKGQVKSQLVSYLRDTEREMLLLLDNFEHLQEGAGLLTEILLQAPQVKILVTSRERLNIQPEWVLPIRVLPYPSLETTEEIERYAAAALFIETARRAQTNFVLDELDKPHLARICQLVEGLPLAIVLAAAWTRSISCREIACEIEQGLDVLVTSSLDIPERHRSIRAVFQHSWNLLSADEQRVLRSLSIFRGGFTRQAAEQVTGASMLHLSALIDKSLIRVDQRLGDDQRYDLHGLIRQFAYERLLNEGEIGVRRVREKHLETFLNLAEQAEPELHGPHDILWLNRLEQDYDNLRAACAWAIDPTRGCNGEHSQRLLRALEWFWCMHGHVDEVCRWAERALSQDSPNEPMRAKAMWVWGYLNYYHGNRDVGRDLMEQGAALCRKLGPSCKIDLAFALNYLGVDAHSRGDIDSAQTYNEKSLALRRELEHSWGIAQSLSNLGDIAYSRGEFSRSKTLLEEGLSVARGLGERSQLARLLNNMGWLMAGQGDETSARLMFRESLGLCRELRWQWMAASVFEYLGIIEARQAEINRLIRAVQLWGASEMLLKSWGASYSLEEAEPEIATARNRLGEASFSIAWSEGRKMTFDQAIAYALED